MLSNFPIKIHGNLFRTSLMSQRACTWCLHFCFYIIWSTSSNKLLKDPTSLKYHIFLFSVHNGNTLSSHLEFSLTSLVSIFSGVYAFSRFLKFCMLHLSLVPSSSPFTLPGWPGWMILSILIALLISLQTSAKTPSLGFS